MTVLVNANTGKGDHTHSLSLFVFFLLHKQMTTAITIKGMNTAKATAKVTVVPMAMATNRSWQCEVNFISEIDLCKEQ